MTEGALDTRETTEFGLIPREPRRRSPWKVVGVVVALWALAMGIGLLVAHDASTRPSAGGFRPSLHADPSQLDFTVGALPDGWKAVKAVGASVAPPLEVMPDQPWSATASYGTHDDPTAPRIWLTHGDSMVAPGFEYLDTLEAVDRQTFTVENRRAECGRIEKLAEVGAGPVQVWCYVDSVQQLVYAPAEGFDVSQMVTIMKSLTFSGSEPRLDLALLPLRTSLLRHSRNGIQDVWATSTVDYGGPNHAGATLTVAWDDEFEFGDLWLHAKEFVKVDVNGTVGYLAESTATGSAMLVWLTDGKAFRLDVRGEADILAMARSVRPAT